MSKKYKLIKKKGTNLFRIKALRNFSNVKKGDLGGLIEKESNLSHDGNAWVYGNAIVSDSAWVYGSAKIYGNAQVSNSAWVYDSAQVYGNARVSGNAKIYVNAQVHGNARVSDSAWVYGSAEVSDSAWVYGSAEVYGGAKVYGSARIQYSDLTTDILTDLVSYIRCSINLAPIGNKYIMYKNVREVSKGVFASLHDEKFLYKTGKIAKVKDPCMDKLQSCVSGLHVSTLTYWERQTTDKIVIACEVQLKDIITCMEGKVRCTKLKVLGKVNMGKEYNIKDRR